MPENWRPVVGYEGIYEVSDQGRVCSVGGRFLSICSDGKGYLAVYLCKNNRCTTKKVHRLVAEAFLGKRPQNQVTCHGPGGRLDNRLENLSYATRSKNNKEDRYRDGTALLGEFHPCSKLTEDDAIAILGSKGKLPQRTIAAIYGISTGHVSAIQTGRKWKHLQSAAAIIQASFGTRNHGNDRVQCLS